MCLCDCQASRSRADAMMEQTSKQPSPSGSNLNSVYNWYTAPYVSATAAASVFHVPLRLSGFSQPCRRNDGADAQTRTSIGKQFEFCVQLVYRTLCVRRRRSKRASMCLCDSCASRSRADAMMQQTSKQPSPSGSNLNSVYNWYTAPYVSDAAAASVLPCAFATLELLAAVQTQ